MNVEAASKRIEAAKAAGVHARCYGEGGYDVTLALAAAFSAGLAVRRASAAKTTEKSPAETAGDKKEE